MLVQIIIISFAFSCAIILHPFFKLMFLKPAQTMILFCSWLSTTLKINSVTPMVLHDLVTVQLSGLISHLFILAFWALQLPESTLFLCISGYLSFLILLVGQEVFLNTPFKELISTYLHISASLEKTFLNPTPDYILLLKSLDFLVILFHNLQFVITYLFTWIYDYLIISRFPY